jgi:rhodanese-related sulfurtransferase
MSERWPGAGLAGAAGNVPTLYTFKEDRHMTTTITRAELLEKMLKGENLAVVEALPPMYYDDAHLPRALNLPHEEVDALAPSLLPDKTQEIVVYCSNTLCQNSTIAARRLTALGYTNVRKYAEGKQDWIEAGLPVEKSAA